MSFPDKFKLLPPDLQARIYQDAETLGARSSAQLHAKAANMNPNYLREKLDRYLARTRKEKKKGTYTPPTGELTPQEEEFLKRLENGTADLEEASRIVAVKVFRAMLENPQSVKFDNFFKTELLKIKQKESEDKKFWAMEIVNRLFAGNPPPRLCPKCGAEIMPITGLAKTPEIHALEDAEVMA